MTIARSKSESAAPYKRTLFDRHGPDGALILRAGMFGVATFALALPLSASLAHKINPQIGSFTSGVFTLLGSATVGVFSTWLGVTTSRFAGRAFARFTMGGSSTPYTEQYSREQALVMRGDVGGALQSFEAVIASQPDAIDARIKAAELYTKEQRNHRRAAELFREVQRIAGVTQGQDVYATNRLVDLHVGPLNDPGRAMVELRRLIERYPESAAATHARTALATLKSRVHADS